MAGIAKFEKVSFEQFRKDFVHLKKFARSVDVKRIYESIKLPERKTIGSAGYDFFSPIDFVLWPGHYITIPTGIRCKIDRNWVLKIYMRSGLGFKYALRLANGTGIIDSDYYDSDNEGHIMIKLINDSSVMQRIEVNAGDGISQGLFIPYGLTVDDHTNGVRNGGFGSTDQKGVAGD